MYSIYLLLIDSAKELLSAAQMEIIDSCMKTVIDQSGIIYNLPNFIINDPLYLKEFDKIISSDVKEMKLIVWLFIYYRYTC